MLKYPAKMQAKLNLTLNFWPFKRKKKWEKNEYKQLELK